MLFLKTDRLANRKQHQLVQQSKYQKYIAIDMMHIQHRQHNVYSVLCNIIYSKHKWLRLSA